MEGPINDKMLLMLSIIASLGALGTKQLYEEAIRIHKEALECNIKRDEGNLAEINRYLAGQRQEASAPSEPSELSPSEPHIPLLVEEPQKKQKVKRESNSKRIHPIARAKAAAETKAAGAPADTPQQTETTHSSGGEKKPSRGLLKAEQRKKEAAKRQELEANGITPTSLLTKENLEQWLASGKTFSQIAREDVGMREEDVSAAAKKHGLSSQKQRLTGRENVIVVKGV